MRYCDWKYIFCIFFILLSLTSISALEINLQEENETKYFDTISNKIFEGNITFGGRYDDQGYSLEKTHDGGYIIIGKTSTYDRGGGDAWLIKIDKNCNEMWNKTYGGRKSDYGFCGQQTTDGGYIISGGTKSFGNGDHDVWLIKTDDAGKELWNRTFGGDEWDQGYGVRQATDGGYIIIGGAKSYGWGPNDYWVIKTDNNGIEEWNETYGLHGYDWGYAIQQTKDGGFIFTGATDTSVKGEHILDIGLIKIDDKGNTEWHKIYHKPLGKKRWDEGYGVQQTQDGGYIIAGIAHTYDWTESGEGDAWLIKTDKWGRKEWDRVLGGIKCDSFSSVKQTQDAGYILSGWTYSYGSGDSDLWLVKTNSEGKELWDITLGGEKREWALAHNLQITSDHSYLITGSTRSYGAGSSDAWLMKIEEPSLIVEITGGQGISGLIKNQGNTDLFDIKWTISIQSPVIQDKYQEGIIDSLPEGGQSSLPQVPISGFGPATIRITGGKIGRTSQCFIIGPLTLMMK
jgi:hypothetical protein